MERRGDYPSDTRRGDFHGRGSEKYGNPAFNVDRTEVRKNIWTRMAGALNIFRKTIYRS